MAELGDRVLDNVTAFEGTVIGRCEYLYDTPSVWVLSDNLDKDGKPVEVWVTEARCTVVGHVSST